MEINIEKTNTMIIGTKKTKHNIEVEGKVLEQVESFNYLGTIIQEDGTLDREINERIGKTGKIYNALRSTFLEKKEIPKRIKSEVYKKVARPSLIYGSESWTFTNKNKSKIVATEMRFLRKIEGITRRDRIRNTTVTNKLDIKPIERIIEERQLGWLGHIHRMGEERTTKKIYELRIPGKNRKGRPRKTWNEQIRAVAEKRDIRWSEARTIAQNRLVWKIKIIKNM